MAHTYCISFSRRMSVMTIWGLIRCGAYIVMFTSHTLCTVHPDTPVDSTTSAPEVDPNVALEGQCVVVCDAEPVAVKSARDQEIRAAENGQNAMRKLWDKMSCPCGDVATASCRSRKVAFSAIRETSLTTSEANPVLIFDHVFLNDGNGFEVSTGKFRAPVDGVYSFSFQIFRISNPDTLNVHLKKNAVTFFQGFAGGNRNSPNAIRSAQSQGLLHLNKGDSVYLQSVEGDMSAGWIHSSFSGHLLYEYA